MSRQQTELDTRREPVQARAKESVDTILAAAAELIDDVGLEGFNTNLLAERAGVRVSTVYRYFPNKYSVIVALTERLAARWDEWMSAMYTDLSDPRRDWRQILTRTRQRWIAHAEAEPGSVTVLQAVNATPELQQLHGRIFDQMSTRLADALQARGARLPRAKLMAVARIIVSSQNAAVELQFRMEPGTRAPFLRELDAMLQAYLEKYLD